MIYTVTFNPAIDYVIKLPGRIELGDINRSKEEKFQFGGKGIGVSAELTAMGCPNVALGFVAGATGNWLEDGLKAQGIRTDFVHLEQGMTRVNVIVEGKNETQINAVGPQVGQKDIERMKEKMNQLEAGDILVLAGSTSSDENDIYAHVMETLKGKDITVAVSVPGAELMNILKYHPFLVKANMHTLREIFDDEAENENEFIQYAVVLQRRGARNVLLTMGALGSLLLDETGKLHRIGVPAGRVVNSVGAGDSMLAGFLVGYQETKDYGYALKLGTAAGSGSAYSDGVANRAKIDRLMEKLKPLEI